MVERAEKQIILARHARRLLNYVDDSPVVPGDARQAYDHELEARQVLEDAENDLRSWVPTVDPIPTADLPANGVEAQDAESLLDGTNGTNGTSVVNGHGSAPMTDDVPSARKQMEEPQSSGGLKSAAEPVPY